MMRIAIFAESFLPKWDGVTTVTCHLLDHLALRGHTTLMFAPEGAPERYAATPIIGLSCLNFPLYSDLRLVPPVVRVSKPLAAFRPDVIHLVNPASLGLVGLRQADVLGVPVVASYHTDIPGYAASYGLPFLESTLWKYFRWIHNRADLNLCPSRFTQLQLEEHGFKRVRVWSQGVDLTRFNPAHRSEAWRARLSAGHPEAPLLLYVGRLAPEKRIHWLRPVIDALPGARLAIVGDGPARADLEQIFAGSPTVFAGYLRGESLSQAFASGDLFVFPSDTETFGQVVLEAMASGLPVVAPRAGGPVDHVLDGRNGYLFPRQDQRYLVDLVRWLVSDLGYVRHMGASARLYAESQTWESINDGLLEEYAATLRDGRERRTLGRTIRPYSQRFRRFMVDHLAWPEREG